MQVQSTDHKQAAKAASDATRVSRIQELCLECMTQLAVQSAAARVTSRYECHVMGLLLPSRV